MSQLTNPTFKIIDYIKPGEDRKDYNGYLVVLNTFAAKITDGYLTFCGGQLLQFQIVNKKIHILHSSGIVVECKNADCNKYFLQEDF